MKVEQSWDYKGLKCVVIMTDMGHRCGYVGIMPTNFFYGINYSTEVNIDEEKKKELLEQPIGKRGVIDILCFNGNFTAGFIFDVHGGITYSGGGENSKYPIESNLWWFGYDCSHCDDAKDLSVVSDSIREIELKFPTNGILRTLDYCIDECNSLAEQLLKFEKAIEYRKV